MRQWLPEGDLALFISDVMDELDLAAIYRSYDTGDGRRQPHSVISRRMRQSRENGAESLGPLLPPNSNSSFVRQHGQGRSKFLSRGSLVKSTDCGGGPGLVSG